MEKIFSNPPFVRYMYSYLCSPNVRWGSSPRCQLPGRVWKGRSTLPWRDVAPSSPSSTYSTGSTSKMHLLPTGFFPHLTTTQKRYWTRSPVPGCHTVPPAAPGYTVLFPRPTDEVTWELFTGLSHCQQERGSRRQHLLNSYYYLLFLITQTRTVKLTTQTLYSFFLNTLPALKKKKVFLNTFAIAIWWI